MSLTTPHPLPHFIWRSTMNIYANKNFNILASFTLANFLYRKLKQKSIKKNFCWYFYTHLRTKSLHQAMHTGKWHVHIYNYLFISNHWDWRSPNKIKSSQLRCTCLSRLKSNLVALVGTITFFAVLGMRYACRDSSLNICKISFCYQLLIFLLDLGQFIVVAGINISTENDISITTSNCVWTDSLLYMLMLPKTNENQKKWQS